MKLGTTMKSRLAIVMMKAAQVEDPPMRRLSQRWAGANATARITPQTIKSAKGARIRAALKSRKAIMTKRTMPSMIQPESLLSSAIDRLQR
jgi:hypothetical protein